jgi:3-phosphoshikimate 1-carboxyvinyltransferase
MQQRISHVSSLSGALTLPGDKSISHRYAMLAAIAEGETRIANYSTGADCHSTLGCLRTLGIPIEVDGATVAIRGSGLYGLQPPTADLDAGNSGSTIRMLSGILAAQPFRSRIFGDESLSRRPMERILRPLTRMGARITARENKYPPLEIEGAPLQPIDYELPVASAQVKTCVLFAGLYADGETIVREPVRSRDHTEVALREFGADISVERGVIRLNGRPRLTGRELYVPSDLSSAAFFIVAALLLPGSRLVIRGVGLNPTRSALLDLLISMGARIRILDLEQVAGEPVGEILIEHAPLQGGVIEDGAAAAVIDEIPVLAVLGAASEQGLVVRDAAELRVKETDRIATVAENLRRMGVAIEETPDGMVIPGKQRFRAATLDSFGDHRIAMAFSIAALRADGECVIERAEAASVSYPEFYQTLRQLTSNEDPR